ncbi:MAG: RNA-binding protein [Christensenellales bacterium]|jgi:RNA-binding protein YlmH
MTEEKRLSELARRAARGETAFSHFLEPALVPIAETCARDAGAWVAFCGGYPGAERVIAGFSDGEIEPRAFPVACLRLSWNKKFADAGHRDILGAVMGLGVERASTGDIVLSDGAAYLFCERSIARYLIENLEGANRARIRAAEHIGEIEPSEPAGTRFRATFSSPRLDALVCAGYNLSRAQAQKLVAAGHVKLNHIPNLRPDARIEAGDLISARGYGRLCVERLLGETKKGRLAAQLFRYGR